MEKRIAPDGSFVERTEPCPECGGTLFYYKKVNQHIGAYCAFCDIWLEWVKQWTDKNWSRYIKERDHYTCKVCGRLLYGKEAQAHHLIPWWMDEKFRYDKNNGVCLCDTCHKRIHGKAGTIKERED